ncbi:glutathione S-transferase [Terfezia claveryi]|nr:glutathione S-transferase [Terfezia claveryi]
MAETKPTITEWADKKTGEYNRKASTFRSFVSREPGAQFPPEKGRYHLYVSYACPWAHRTLIVRELKGLQDIISFSAVHPHMTEGGWHFPTPTDNLPGLNAIPDPLYNFKRLSDLYFRTNSNFEGRYTVPVLWDKKNETIVNNESSEIIRMLYTEFDDFVDEEYKGVEFLRGRKGEVDEMNAWVYDGINNGVYKSGFATAQEPYDKAVKDVFESLDRVEQILTNSPGPYLLGEELTEADIRLYVTIIRFDIVYVQHFKCNIRDIRSGYPRIHNWLRHLYWDIPAFRNTTEFNHIKTHYFLSHPQINPHGIIPMGPLPHIFPKDESKDFGGLRKRT